MPTVRRSRTIDAPAHAIWSTVADPHALPRWWPQVERVEGVDGPKFTEVMRTSKGRPVRLDHTMGQRRQGEELSWHQELENTPFERYFAESSTTIRLAPAGEGATTVTIELRQKLRGTAKLGSFMTTRAAKDGLDAALEGLAAIFV
jgi:uncharacterized protein YndB with AHSA1/START domain